MAKKRASENGRIIQVVMHILGIFFSFIPSLVVLFVSENKETKNHARNALNWQISAIIYTIVSLVLVLILIGVLLLIIVGILNLAFCIVAAVKASDGKCWEYPLTIKFLETK